jgi:nitrite reductase/ring-hydroxylating ferredoxin subunit
MSAIINLLKAIAGICETQPLGLDLWGLEGNRVTVRVGEVPELQRPGGAVYLKGKGLKPSVLIVRSEDDGFLCFANKCTHGGWKLDPVAGKSELRCCSVNHSTFNFEGAKLTGPAKGPIRVYNSEMKDGNLLIDL